MKHKLKFVKYVTDWEKLYLCNCGWERIIGSNIKIAYKIHDNDILSIKSKIKNVLITLPSREQLEKEFIEIGKEYETTYNNRNENV